MATLCKTSQAAMFHAPEQHHDSDKYAWCLRIIGASELCCPQCRTLTVAMLNKADRMGVLSLVVQTFLDNFQAADDVTLIGSLRLACRSHGLDVQRFRIRHPAHKTLIG